MGYTKHDYQSNDILYAADLAEMDNQIYKNEQDILKLEENKQPVGNYASSEEVSQLRSDLNEISNMKSGVIIQTASGESIVTNDSSDDPLRGLRVFGKTEQFTTTGAQLFDVSKIVNTSTVGLTTIVNSDGSLTVNGTPSQAYATAAFIPNIQLEPGTYYVSGGKNAAGGVYAQMNITLSDGTFKYYTDKVFEIDGTEQKVTLNIQASADLSTINNFTLYPMLNKGTTPLPWEPYTGGIPSPNPQYKQGLVSAGDDGDVEVGVYGKNLFKQTWGKVPSISTGLDVSTDSTTVSSDYIRVDANKTYTISTDATFSDSYLFAYDENKSYLGYAANRDTLCQFPTLVKSYPSVQYLRIRFDGATRGIFQFEEGSVATECEPYTEQTLTALTPNGLQAIPVTDASLATYTDADGQMWCADEKDYEHGTNVQRVKEVVFDGSDDEGWYVKDLPNDIKVFVHPQLDVYNSILSLQHGAMSNVGYVPYINLDNGGYGLTYAYGVRIRFENMNPNNNTLDELRAYLGENPITFIYPLATPIETPLSEEELTAYRALHSNYPVTTVLNDSGAHMEVKYNADTKNYIDNKFAELQTALIALGGI